MLKYLKRNSFSKKKEFSLIAEDGESVRVPRTLILELCDMTKLELKTCLRDKLEGVTAATLQKFAEYIYQRKISFFDHMEALEVLNVAKQLKMKDLEKTCEEYLFSAIDTSNACDVFEKASFLTMNNLEYLCLKYIDYNISSILSSRHFLFLQKSTVREIVSRSSLNLSSEKLILDAVLQWSLNEIHRQGSDMNNEIEVIQTMKPLLLQVRFHNMSEDELEDDEVSKYHKLVTVGRRERSCSGNSQSSSGTVDSSLLQTRYYRSHYVASLNVLDSIQPTVRNGEIFCMRIEVLKGRIFLTGVALAMRAFASTKDSTCLYAVITATNVSTGEHSTKRDTFFNITEKTVIVFSTPLTANESEKIEVALSCKQAENVCPFSVSNDIQIVMPECQRVAMKVSLPDASRDFGRSIFGEIEYFF